MRQPEVQDIHHKQSGVDREGGECVVVSDRTMAEQGRWHIAENIGQTGLPPVNPSVRLFVYPTNSRP